MKDSTLLILVIAAAFAFTSGAATKEDAPVGAPVAVQVTSDPLDDLPRYDTIEEAGVHAIMRAYQCSHYYECGGLIARDTKGKYVVGPVRSNDAGDMVNTGSTVPEDFTLVGDYHIHPCLKDSHYVNYFSPQDVSAYLTAQVIGFMGDMCTGEVHEFDPAKDKMADTKIAENLYLTKGRIIGHILVDGKSVEPDTGL